MIRFYTHKKHKKNTRYQRTVLNFFLVKKLSCLNDSGPTKLVNVHTAIQIKSSLVGPVRKLNYLNDIKTSFLRPFKFFIFLQKDFARTRGIKSTKSNFFLLDVFYTYFFIFVRCKRFFAFLCLWNLFVKKKIKRLKLT